MRVLHMKKNLILLLMVSAFHAGAQNTKHTIPELPALEAQYRSAKKDGNPNTIADAAFLAGQAHQQSANFKRSIDYLLVAKAIYKSENDSKNLAQASCLLATNYHRLGNDKRYKDYIALAQQLIGKDTLSAGYELLLDTQIGYYQAKGKPMQLKYLKAIKARLHAVPEAEPAKPEAVPLKKNPVVAKKTMAKPKPSTHPIAAKSHTDYLLALAIALFALAAGSLIYYFYKERRRKLVFSAKQEIGDAQLLANISQAIRNADGHPERISAIAEQTKLLSELKNGKKQPQFAPVPIGPLLQSITAPYLQNATRQNTDVIANITVDVDEKLVDQNTLETILQLLWSEPLQAAVQQSVYFSATIEQEQLDLRISYPSGPVTEKHLPQLLESLFLPDTENYPNPVGFALLDGLVAWYDGKIEVSLDGSLLRIAIRLPLSETQRKPMKHVHSVVL